MPSPYTVAKRDPSLAGLEAPRKLAWDRQGNSGFLSTAAGFTGVCVGLAVGFALLGPTGRFLGAGAETLVPCVPVPNGRMPWYEAQDYAARCWTAPVAADCPAGAGSLGARARDVCCAELVDFLRHHASPAGFAGVADLTDHPGAWVGLMFGLTWGCAILFGGGAGLTVGRLWHLGRLRRAATPAGRLQHALATIGDTLAAIDVRDFERARASLSLQPPTYLPVRWHGHSTSLAAFVALHAPAVDIGVVALAAHQRAALRVTVGNEHPADVAFLAAFAGDGPPPPV